MPRRFLSPRRLGLTLLVALLGLPLSAQDLRPVDRPRIERFAEIFGQAMLQALAGATPEEATTLAAALQGEPGEPDPVGDWSCRTIKLGGLLPISLYPPFQCRITETAPNLWRIEKLTGSQRLEGVLSVQEGGVLYQGTGFVDGGPAQPYEAFPPDEQVAVEPGQTYPQVGFFEQAGPGQARLLMPQPMFESQFDILWLSR